MDDVQDISKSLILAASEGRLKIVKQLIKYYGLFYSKDWSEGYTLLNSALLNNHTEVAKLLLISGSKVNDTSLTNTTTPLHFAVQNDDTEIVEMLLDKGADVNAKDEYERTPLYNAIGYNKIEMIKLLLKHGAEVNIRSILDLSPLHEAIKSEYSQIVEYLLKHGANVNYVCPSCKNLETYSPLHFASTYNNKKIVTLLLNNGANINVRGANNTTPLHIATEYGYEDIVLLFLKRGVDINPFTNENLTPLHIAINKKFKSIVKLLLQYGAKVDNQNKYGKTALNLAVKTGCSMIVLDVLNFRPDINNKSNIISLKTAVYGQSEEYKKIVEALLEYGFKIDLEDTDLLQAAITGGHITIIENLLKHGIDLNYLLNSIMKENFMPLHVAAYNKQKEIGKLLITYGADINARDNTGKTPIFYTIQNDDVKFTKLLLKNGAIVKNNPELLIKAVKINCLEIVKALMRYNVNINAVDEYGFTALHYTASRTIKRSFGFLYNENPVINFKAEIAKLLLCNGANVQAKTKERVTALHLATQNRYQKVIEVLLQYNADINTKDIYGRTALHFSATCEMLNSPQYCFIDDPELKIAGEVTKLLLSNGANVNAKTESGQTTLHFAAEKGYVKIVEALLQYNVDVNASDKYGRTALHVAAKNDFRNHFCLIPSINNNIANFKAAIARLLLSKGANVNAKTKSGLTALYAAITGGYLKVVEVLLEFDADVCDINGNGPLHYIVLNEREDFIGRFYVEDIYVDIVVKAEIAKMLLRKGVNVNAQNKSGLTILHIATQKGYLHIIKVLLEHDADVNIYDINRKTALHYTVMNEKEDFFFNVYDQNHDIKVMAEIAKLLLSKGAYTEVKSDYDITPLHAATQKGYAKIVETLLEYNANVNCRMIQNLTPLHIAAEKGLQNIMKILLKFGADINSRDFNGRTALHVATQKSLAHIVKYLLENNADANCGTLNGYTPLHTAAENGFQEIIEILLKFDANVNFRDTDGRTALHVATHKGYTQIVQTLLEHNADVNCRLPNGYTPLHIAAENGFQEIIEICLEFDADISFIDVDGRTALYIASLRNDYNVATTLLEYGSSFNFIRMDDKIMLIPDSSDINFSNIEFYSYFDAELNQQSRVLSSEIFEAYIREAIKLKVAKLYISERNLLSLRFDKMGHFIAKCEKEIANMKSEKINNTIISFYDILVKNTTLLATCMRNENIVQVLKSKNYETIFPLYAKRIKCNFIKAMHRKELQEKGIQIFHFLFNNTPELPSDCIEKIVSYWNNKDIETLFDTCNSKQKIRRSFTRNSDF